MGGINGLYQIIGEVLMPIRKSMCTKFGINKESIGQRIISVLFTFVFIDFTWIFFRAGDVKVAFNTIKSIITVYNPWILFDGSLYNCGLDIHNFNFLCFSVLILFFADFCKTKGIVIREVVCKQDVIVKCIFIIVSVCCILLFGKWGPQFDKASFIYFQF